MILFLNKTNLIFFPFNDIRKFREIIGTATIKDDEIVFFNNNLILKEYVMKYL